ncbi:hypothetical protein [Sphingopyxis terrae]|uniref:hypothetical protein n=1 Tax=Sphingopyxis terrae TaxID=33052 RepID=UPI002A1241C6|nr:hypothetical protein [Sphingopyxis terrae]MDX8356182.1 hypothetical protein [Sphingopyxis terrae]
MSAPRILFLFNHDAAHQAAHIAGLAAAVARRGVAEVIIAYGTPTIRAVVEGLLSPGEAAKMQWAPLDLTPVLDTALAPLNRVAPVRRLARLDRHRALFASVDIIVSPERTCLRVKRALGERAPRFVFVPHGAGDRSVTYHPEMAQFDLMLVSGQKVVDEMGAHGIMPPERCRIIGYPKFDTVDMTERPRFFDNGNPVFLYNPHFDPYLSSWYDMGHAVIALFAAHPGLNLIVAPHVMLFRKKLHYSLEYRTMRRRPEIPAGLPANIRVDTASERLFDMSYTRAADVYIGDVSSQVYEFLAHRDACFFLDPRGQARDVEAMPYQFWENGDVCGSIGALAALLPDWRTRADRYRPVQDRLFAYTMDYDPARPAVERGADALLAYAADMR